MCPNLAGAQLGMVSMVAGLWSFVSGTVIAILATKYLSGLNVLFIPFAVQAVLAILSLPAVPISMCIQGTPEMPPEEEDNVTYKPLETEMTGRRSRRSSMLDPPTGLLNGEGVVKRTSLIIPTSGV
eukprot:gnl/TRDRNA2_/TRDRNA2_57505_c0_seq1.p1 gnl/TRDRNA2_/TRDRNA2_57505_c0~~gnl/TRDRNA2_/TRDRNA2_57505_c0_seq1.p1  ORF type:complete len:126 (+),score=14.82 gnl/TRDRNA2_/TRDRNA2_57505_c0_seq1:1-378(+)